jgi:hypothetical protein
VIVHLQKREVRQQRRTTRPSFTSHTFSNGRQPNSNARNASTRNGARIGSSMRWMKPARSFSSRSIGSVMTPSPIGVRRAFFPSGRRVSNDQLLARIGAVTIDFTSASVGCPLIRRYTP